MKKVYFKTQLNTWVKISKNFHIVNVVVNGVKVEVIALTDDTDLLEENDILFKVLEVM